MQHPVTLVSCLFPTNSSCNVKSCQALFDLKLYFFCGFSFWIPGHDQKGPMKEGLPFCLSICPIVCPSSCLSVSFPRIGSLVFSDTWYGVRGPYLVTCDRAGFFWKMNDVKNGQKGPKNKVFCTFQEYQVIDFVCNWCKPKVIMVL